MSLDLSIGSQLSCVLSSQDLGQKIFVLKIYAVMDAPSLDYQDKNSKELHARSSSKGIVESMDNIFV